MRRESSQGGLFREGLTAPRGMRRGMMSCTYEGTIEIDLEDFAEFVANYHPEAPSVAYGVPRVNKSNETIEIDFAVGTDDCGPSDWAEKPKCLKQWDGI